MTQDKYKSRFQNPEFEKVFLGYKKYILRAEIEFSRKCAALIAPRLGYSKVNILELGAGEGSVSLGFLQKFSKTKTIKKYTAIDLSPHLVDLLEKKENHFKRYVQDVYFECFDAEEYKPREKYELILALNSFYGISFTVIPRLFPHLQTEGIIAVLINSQNCLTLDLTRKFSEPMASAEDFIGWLDRKNIHYKVYDLKTKRLSKKDFILENKLNPSAELAFRYLLRRIHEPLEGVFEYLSKKSEGYFEIPQKLVLISK